MLSVTFTKSVRTSNGNTGPLIVPYHREELIQDLNQVAPYDWAGFLHERVDLINPHADLAGIERGGYKLVYRDQLNASERTIAEARRPSPPNPWYSLGFRIANDGTVLDVRWGGPSDKATLAPGYRLIAVNGNIYSKEALNTAIVAAKSSTEPIHLLVQTDSYIRPIDIDYHDGERYPALVRAEGTNDYLDEITSPLAKPQPQPVR